MERQVGQVDATKPGSPVPPSSGAVANGTPDPNEQGRATKGDLITALILAVAFGAVLNYLNFLSFLKVLFGLSFVIFIHEFGHFIVAKMCDVHVTHFSIGFGPVIPGCWFKWGETTYQVCLLPLGGYVQMVGQVDGDETSDGSENDPRSYRNKSVGARMAIISAGVIMNVILAFVIFIVVYRGPGKVRIAAVLGEVDPGGPAFVYGMRSDMVIEQIGDIKKPYFDDLRQTVAGSHAGEQIEIIARREGDAEPVTIRLEARKSKADANPVLGVTFAATTNFETKRHVADEFKMPAFPGTPAERAEPKFEFGDAIVATTDPARPDGSLAPLGDDPLQPGQKNYAEFMKRMQLLAGRPVKLKVQRESKPDKPNETTSVEITVDPAYQITTGAVMEMGNIVSIRKGSPAEDAKIQLPEVAAGKKFLNGDLIEKVEVTDADGKPLVFEKNAADAARILDPERLPWQLKQWAQRLVAAGKMDAKTTVGLTVRRHRKKGGEEFDTVKVDLAWDNGWAYDRAQPFSPTAPNAIPELGLAYQIRTTVRRESPAFQLEPDSFAYQALKLTAGFGFGMDWCVDRLGQSSQLKAGDVIKNFRLTYVEASGKDGKDGKEKTTGWMNEDLKEGDWAFIGLTNLQQQRVAVKRIEFKVHRNNEAVEVSIVPKADSNWPRINRGWLLAQDTRVQRADTTLDAIALGFRDTGRSMKAILNGIRQMITGRIDIFKHLGGPLSIMNIAYQIAGNDFWEFVFFLGLISINLAVINFLPIPLLDGGHMVFLTYELIRGKPASEGVRQVALWIGLAFIACLILLVTYLDIFRLFT